MEGAAPVKVQPRMPWWWFVVAALAGAALGATFTYITAIHFANF